MDYVREVESFKPTAQVLHNRCDPDLVVGVVVFVLPANTVRTTRTTTTAAVSGRDTCSTMASPAQSKVTANGTPSAAPPAGAHQAERQRGRPAAAAAPAPTRSTSSPTVTLLLAAAGGAGMLCGFLVFYLLYRSQCAVLLTDRSVEFNSTMDKWQSIDDQKHIERQKHLLQQQTSLTDRHQNLLEKLAEQQNAHEATKRLFQQESEKVQQMTLSLHETTTAATAAESAATKKTERLQRQLELAKTMLQEKVDEVEELKANADDELDNCPTATKDSNNEAYYQLQSAVRRQNAVQLGLLYGEPPYMVNIYLKSTGQSAFPVEVQIASVHEMPHAIHTFLSLVQADAFLETSWSQYEGIINQGRLIGGSPASTSRKQVQAKLIRRYAEQGYTSTEPLLFPERSSQPCRAGSLGWIRHGPSLVLHVMPTTKTTGSDDNDNDDFTCFGRIVSGLDQLETFMTSSSSSSSSAAEQQRLSVVDARVVAAAAAAHHDDEL
jgi:hypothetical protein